MSLRTHRAEELYRWVALVLEGSLPLAARAAARMQDAETYPMYLTRDLEGAKVYVRTRYEGVRRTSDTGCSRPRTRRTSRTTTSRTTSSISGS